jgi:hypothetical protein
MIFLRNIKGKTKINRIRNEKIRDKHTERLTSNRMRWYGPILKMNEERIPNEVMKAEGKCPSRLRLRLEQQVW